MPCERGRSHELRYLHVRLPIRELASGLDGPNGLPLIRFRFTPTSCISPSGCPPSALPSVWWARFIRFPAPPVTRVGPHDVGWYNLLACSIVSFFIVGAGFYEIMLAVPVSGVTSALGPGAMTTMLWHGVGGVILLLLIVAMTVWRAYQRFAWRKDYGRQVG